MHLYLSIETVQSEGGFCRKWLRSWKSAIKEALWFFDFRPWFYCFLQLFFLQVRFEVWRISVLVRQESPLVYVVLLLTILRWVASQFMGGDQFVSFLSSGSQFDDGLGTSLLIWRHCEVAAGLGPKWNSIGAVIVLKIYFLHVRLRGWGIFTHFCLKRKYYQTVSPNSK